MTFREFLISYREEHGLSQRRFAALCGLTNGYISMLEKGVNPSTGKAIVPSITAYQSIARATGVPLGKLLAMSENAPPQPDTAAAVLPLPHDDVARCPRLHATVTGATFDEQNIACDDVLPDNVSCDFSVVCRDNSMASSRLHQGDIVYARTASDATHGELVAARIGNEIVLRQLCNTSRGVLLITADASLPPAPLGDNVTVLGKVVGVTSTALSYAEPQSSRLRVAAPKLPFPPFGEKP